jgi:hypothetical protein
MDAEPRAPNLTPGSKASLAADVGSNSPSARRERGLRGHGPLWRNVKRAVDFTLIARQSPRHWPPSPHRIARR